MLTTKITILRRKHGLSWELISHGQIQINSRATACTIKIVETVKESPELVEDLVEEKEL